MKCNSDYTILFILSLVGGVVLLLINEVTLRRARLVPGWVTVMRAAKTVSLCNLHQADSTFYPPWNGKISISFQFNDKWR